MKVLVFLKVLPNLPRYGVVYQWFNKEKSPLRTLFFHLFSSILQKQKLPKIDGLISIRRAFIKKRCRAIPKKTGYYP